MRRTAPRALVWMAATAFVGGAGGGTTTQRIVGQDRHVVRWCAAERVITVPPQAANHLAASNASTCCSATHQCAAPAAFRLVAVVGTHAGTHAVLTLVSPRARSIDRSIDHCPTNRLLRAALPRRHQRSQRVLSGYSCANSALQRQSNGRTTQCNNQQSAILGCRTSEAHGPVWSSAAVPPSPKSNSAAGKPNLLLCVPPHCSTCMAVTCHHTAATPP